MKKTALSTLAICGVGLLATACGGGSDGSASITGQFSLAVTDAPLDTASRVVVRFAEVTLHSPQNEDLNFVYCPGHASTSFVRSGECASPQVLELDLLALSGSEGRALIEQAAVPAGQYPWMRLGLDAQNPGYLVTQDGGQHPLSIPSGDEAGLKFNRGFNVAQGGKADFTIDFDLRKSVHVQGNQEYKLRPTLRLLDNNEVGSIQGTVAAVDAACRPAVYIYAGAGVTPDDLGGKQGEPLATALVKLDPQDGLYHYRVHFLEAGAYTVALTCQADLDDPAKDDDLVFTASATTGVAKGVPARVDF